MALISLVALAGCSKTSDPAAPAPSPSTTAAPASTTSSGGPTSTRAPGTTTSERAAGTTTTVDETSTTDAPKAAKGTAVDLGGLTVVVPADATVPDPESGVTLTAGSVYTLPGESFGELADVDATNRVVTSIDGDPVVIYLFGSDTLFDVGSPTVKSTAEGALPAVVVSIDKRAPKSKLLVRGFTDSSGTAAANQTLSEQRASALAAWLGDHGIDKSRITTSGYGSKHPAAEEDSDAGKALNRRIEIVAVG